MSVVIYYDITRILSKASAPTPTGIDRVDIRYAKYYLENDKFKPVYVYTSRSVFKILEINFSRKLIELVYAKWIEGFTSIEEERWLSTEPSRKLELRNIVKHTSVKGSVCDKKFKAVDGELIDLLHQYQRRPSCYLNTSHYGVGNNSCIHAYYVFKTLGGAGIVFYLHDLIPLDYPEYVNEGDDKGHGVRVNAMANYADLVIVNSEYTKDRFNHYCKVNMLRCPKVSIALIGIEESFMKAASEGLQEERLIHDDYFITVSTIEPRKNHMLLLQVWREMVEEKRDRIPRLVIVGKRGWSNSSTFSFLDRCPHIQPYVSEISGLSDQQLIALMKGAKAMLFPSFVEGWGMPVVEAMALGLPIICSDIPAFIESGQNIPLYHSPINGTMWKEEILRLNNDDSYLKKYKCRIRDYVFPVWEDHFAIADAEIKAVSACSAAPLRPPSSEIFKRSMEVDNSDITASIIEVNPSKKPGFILKSFRTSGWYEVENMMVRRYVNERKYSKYCKNRDVFFGDSKSKLIKLYHRATSQ